MHKIYLELKLANENNSATSQSPGTIILAHEQYLPGRTLAISAHLFPCIRWAFMRANSSSNVHASFLIPGFKWLCHLKTFDYYSPLQINKQKNVFVKLQGAIIDSRKKKGMYNIKHHFFCCKLRDDKNNDYKIQTTEWSEGNYLHRYKVAANDEKMNSTRASCLHMIVSIMYGCVYMYICADLCCKIQCETY